MRIRFGIKNLYYAPATDDGSGKLTYGTPVAVIGAKSMSLSAQGDEVTEYADDAVYYSETINNGYNGTVEFEDNTSADDFLVAVLGWTKDETTGMVTEKTTDQAKEFALLWQFSLKGGDETGKRSVLYRCKISRPNIEGQTKESGITVNTNSVTITALPRISDDAVKSSVTSADSLYADWFTKVQEPGATTSA